MVATEREGTTLKSRTGQYSIKSCFIPEELEDSDAKVQVWLHQLVNTVPVHVLTTMQLIVELDYNL